MYRCPSDADRDWFRRRGIVYHPTLDALCERVAIILNDYNPITPAAEIAARSAALKQFEEKYRHDG